jgi:hypothetical protein
MVATKEKFFSPTKLSAQQKAATTHDAAMQIIDAEVSAREKKTQKLRQLRLEQEAAKPVVTEAAAAPKGRKRKAD